jgi:hypothetical protein
MFRISCPYCRSFETDHGPQTRLEAVLKVIWIHAKLKGERIDLVLT